MNIILRIWSNTNNCKVLAKRIGLEPSKSYSIGDIYLLNGHVKERVHSYLEFRISDYMENESSFEEQLLYLLKLLRTKNDIFSNLKCDNEIDLAIKFVYKSNSMDLDNGIESAQLELISSSVNWISFGC